MGPVQASAWTTKFIFSEMSVACTIEIRKIENNRSIFMILAQKVELKNKIVLFRASVYFFFFARFCLKSA